MKQKYLKLLRVIISLSFFLLTGFLFIDLKNTLSFQFTGSLLYLQFVPSLLKFLCLLSFTAVGFILVIILTVMFGRVYCSSVCPLGTLQDVISFFSRKIYKKKKFKFTNAHALLRYGILILTIIFFISGSILFINLLDPYSNFGRISTNLFRPLYILTNNLFAKGFEWFGSYAFSPFPYKKVNAISILFPLTFLIVIFWLAATKGRLYCNTICPVGSLLGFISKISFFKIQISHEACNSCSLCASVCKSSCINPTEKNVDMSRCVGCFNCLSVCKKDALKYNFTSSLPKETEHSQGRRKVLLSVAGLSLAKVLLAQENITKFKTGLSNTGSKLPISPPGSKGLHHFSSTCTACHLCVSACPTQVLQPSLFEYGLAGMLQPRMDFHTNYCNYKCTACSHVCPSGAIIPLTEEEKKSVQIGIAKFVKKNCVVYVNNTDCGACSEHCPTKAVHMIPYINDLVIPEVNTEICVGCGACEHACPTQPYKAIYVESNTIHKKAKSPQRNKQKEKVDMNADFPF